MVRGLGFRVLGLGVPGYPLKGIWWLYSRVEGAFPKFRVRFLGGPQRGYWGRSIRENTAPSWPPE